MIGDRAKYGSGATQRLGEAGDGKRACAGLPPREENDSGGIGRSHLCELFGNLRDGIVPRDRPKLCLAARAGAFHRTAQAIWVVQRLHRSLTARTEAAAGDWIERITLNLLD